MTLDPQALDLETAAALGSLILALQGATEIDNAEEIIAKARERGVADNFCDSLHREWLRTFGGAA